MKIIFHGFTLLLFLSACHTKPKQAADTPPQTDSLAQVSKQPNSGVRSQDTAQPISSDRQIIPGKRIGMTSLEEDPEVLTKTLGKPDYSDAAMGKAWLTWMGKKDMHNNRTQLDIFITYKDTSMSSKVVRQIRTTSSWFILEDSIHVYNDLPTIQKAYPQLKYTGKYENQNREIKIYDDLSQGIAFEMVHAGTQAICIAIIVHVPGKPLTAVYFPINPGNAVK